MYMNHIILAISLHYVLLCTCMCISYSQQMPSQQPSALMPTPTIQSQMTTPTMGGAQNQYAPPTMPGSVGGFPQQQQQPQPPPHLQPQGLGAPPMSAMPSSLMSAPVPAATSLPTAPSTSLYGSGGPPHPQQLLQPPTNVAPPPVAHAGGVGGIPMAMTPASAGVATAGGVVAPQASTASSTPAIAMATASGGVGMPAASGGSGVNANIAGGSVSGVGGAGGGSGSVGTPNAGTEKKKKKKKVHVWVLLYLYCTAKYFRWTIISPNQAICVIQNHAFSEMNFRPCGKIFTQM